MRAIQALVAGFLVVGAAAGAVGQWTKLANERGTCTITKLTLVRYGANNSYYYTLADKNIPCASGVFGGDPAGGSEKVCEGGDTANPHPYIGWTRGVTGSNVFAFYTPQNYQDSGKIPLILYMHPVGDKGNQYQNTTHNDLHELASDTSQQRNPCFIYAPQCPDHDFWFKTNKNSDGSPDFYRYNYEATNSPTTAWLDAIKGLDSVLAKYPIDLNRIYIIGGSMGGYATWYTLMKYPTRFAAAIAVAGGGDTTQVAPYAKMPMRAFHDGGDPIVDPFGSESMIRAMKRGGGNPTLTTNLGNFTDAQYEHFGGHWYVIPFAVSPGLKTWLFSQQKIPVSTLTGMSRNSKYTAALGWKPLSLQVGVNKLTKTRLVYQKEGKALLVDIRGQIVRE